MSFKFLGVSVLGIFHPEPVVARRHWAAVIGTVPSGAHWAQLLEQLPEAVKDKYFCRRVTRCKPDYVPRVVITVIIGREIWRIIYHPYLNRHTTTTILVPYGNRMVARRYVVENIAVLERPVV